MGRGARRWTVEVFGGQTRAYGDTEHIIRVSAEWIPYSGPEEWTPNNELREECYREIARATKFWREDGIWPGPRLQSSTKVSSNCWEFVVVEEFTD